jgi:hypothetical protein
MIKLLRIGTIVFLKNPFTVNFLAENMDIILVITVITRAIKEKTRRMK